MLVKLAECIELHIRICSKNHFEHFFRKNQVLRDEKCVFCLKIYEKKVWTYAKTDVNTIKTRVLIVLELYK